MGSFERVSSAKLNRLNHCLVYPVTVDGDRYQVDSGWKILGWSTAPFSGRFAESSKAIVFEKTSPALPSLFDVLSDLEPGVYWCHGDIDSWEVVDG